MALGHGRWLLIFAGTLLNILARAIDVLTEDDMSACASAGPAALSTGDQRPGLPGQQPHIPCHKQATAARPAVGPNAPTPAVDQSSMPSPPHGTGDGGAGAEANAPPVGFLLRGVEPEGLGAAAWLEGWNQHRRRLASHHAGDAAPRRSGSQQRPTDHLPPDPARHSPTQLWPAGSRSLAELGHISAPSPAALPAQSRRQELPPNQTITSRPITATVGDVSRTIAAAAQANQDLTLKCVICRSEVLRGEEAATTLCMRTTHAGCLERWVEREKRRQQFW